jgi:hypothetical protein
MKLAHLTEILEKLKANNTSLQVGDINNLEPSGKLKLLIKTHELLHRKLRSITVGMFPSLMEYNNNTNKKVFGIEDMHTRSISSLKSQFEK